MARRRSPVAESTAAPSEQLSPDRYPTALAGKQLVYFTAVVEQGSLGRAARVLHVTQPALTKSVRALERQLKVRLLERTARGVVPTAFGQEVARHALSITTLLRRLHTGVDAMRGVRASAVRVRMDAASSPLMGLAIAQLIAHSPAVEFLAQECSARRAIDAVANEEADLAVISGYQGSLPPHLDRIELQEDDGVAVARSGHPLTRATSMESAALASFPIVAPPPPNALHEFWSRAAAGRATACRIRTASLAAARLIVLRSDAICIFPRSAVHDDIERGRLVVLPFDGIGWSLSRSVVTRRGQPQPVVVTMLVDQLMRSAA